MVVVGGGGGLVPDTPPTTTSNCDKKIFVSPKSQVGSLGVVVGGGLNITSTISGTFYIWEDD